MNNGIVEAESGYNHRKLYELEVIFLMKAKAKRYAIVRETSAHQFEECLNEKLFELRDLSPTVEFSETGDYMTARISYEDTVDVPDQSISEKGFRFTCEDCPCFEHLLKSDGSIDKRIKYGNCNFSKYGRTLKNSAACELLYRMIENGEVSLCISK